MATNRHSQKQRILTHLEAGLTLTPLEALRQFRCFRLAARVDDLRGEGHHIVNKGKGGDHAVYKYVKRGRLF